MTSAKLTNGPNDRAKDATISQTAPGLPDDSGRPLEIDEAEAARIEQGIRNMGKTMPTGPQQPYDAEASDGDKAGGSTASDALKSDVAQDIDLPLKGSA